MRYGRAEVIDKIASFHLSEVPHVKLCLHIQTKDRQTTEISKHQQKSSNVNTFIPLELYSTGPNIGHFAHHGWLLRRLQLDRLLAAIVVGRDERSQQMGCAHSVRHSSDRLRGAGFCRHDGDPKRLIRPFWPPEVLQRRHQRLEPED